MNRTPILFALSLLGIVTACTSSGSSGDDEDGGGSGGSESDSGTGGGSGDDAGSGGGTGGDGDDGGTGGSPSGDGGTLDCGDAGLLPDTIDTDTTVGPGCVRVYRTTITEGATLTVVPGTKVVFEPGGFLNAARSQDSSALVAVGTEEEPIVFTSAAASPAPGDWQCVRIGASSSASELRHAILEYGGEACAATGADYEALLDVDAGMRAVSNVTFRHSSTRGILIKDIGGIRGSENNVFSGNGESSVLVEAPQIPILGPGNVFEDDDDFIEVDTTFALGSSGTWTRQPVPYRLVGDLLINAGAEVVIEAGTVIQLSGGSLEVFAAALDVDGTEADPVRFTSADDDPLAGDWGCLIYSSPTDASPRIASAIFEYGGSGAGCSGANHKTALVVPNGAQITTSTFREIDGAGIKAGTCNTASWCENTFEDTVTSDMLCGVAAPGTPTDCP